MDEDNLVELPAWVRRRRAEQKADEVKPASTLAERLRRARDEGDRVVDVAELERTLERLRAPTPPPARRRRD